MRIAVVQSFREMKAKEADLPAAVCAHMNLANTVGKRGRSGASGACVSGNQSGIS